MAVTPQFRALTAGDYAAMWALWTSTPGMGLSRADEAEPVAAFLARNPGLSWAAWNGPELLGTVLVGHDGRRGLMHHLAIAPGARRMGLARELLRLGLQGLAQAGIDRCHVLVFADNSLGRAFWDGVGAQARHDVALYSLDVV